MKIKIEVKLGNAAMVTSQDVLKSINASRLNLKDSQTFEPGENGDLYDYNGNHVGSWKVTK